MRYEISVSNLQQVNGLPLLQTTILQQVMKVLPRHTVVDSMCVLSCVELQAAAPPPAATSASFEGLYGLFQDMNTWVMTVSSCNCSLGGSESDCATAIRNLLSAIADGSPTG
jgi:hypothetical protein